MPLRIAFDLDGVLADMETELVRQAERLFGDLHAHAPRLDQRPAETAQTQPQSIAARGTEGPGVEDSRSDAPSLLKPDLTARQHRRLWEHVESIDNFWETLQECEPGTVKRLAAIAADRRWEVIFLTRRPETAGATAQVQSQRWLQSRGFELPSVYVVQGSRGRIAAALDLDIVIDDRPENCLDVVVDSRARAILVWRDDRSQAPAATRQLGVAVVGSVGECLGVLEQAGRSDERPGFLARVMRALGLKESIGPAY